MTVHKDTSSPTPSNSTYRAFLIRCWHEDNNWRFSLETIGQDPQRRGFACYEELANYLKTQFVQEDSDLAGRR